jgi:hypothetical protein
LRKNRGETTADEPTPPILASISDVAPACELAGAANARRPVAHSDFEAAVKQLTGVRRPHAAEATEKARRLGVCHFEFFLSLREPNRRAAALATRSLKPAPDDGEALPCWMGS